jgi:diguanylate cyclase (GGDEF)-like protein
MTSKLFQPIKLRDLALENRVMVSPMCQYSAVDGCMTDWHLAHLGMLANSGAALLCFEMTDVEPVGRITLGCSGLYSDANEAALRRVVEFCRAHGQAKLAIQVGHAGRKASTAVPWDGGKALRPDEGGWQPVAPSAISPGEGEPVPHALATDEIKMLLAKFSESVRRAERIGFDALELHAAHGYLLHEFLSPLSNRREDEYGGSLANRMRFPLEVVAAMRAVWPAHRPLGVRLSCTDWIEGGWNIEQTVAFARELKKLGCDWIDCSSGGLMKNQVVPVAPGYQVSFAERVRKDAEIATTAIGMITEARRAESIIAEGKADMVALARGFLWDPRWAWHAALELGVAPRMPPQYLRGRPAERADKATVRLGRMFAALSAANDAILHAKSLDELYERVCNAAVHSGNFSNTTILLAEEGTTRTKAVASAGRVPQLLQASHISVDETIPEGRGLVGIAFRTQRPCVSNDFLHDERTRPWHEIGRKAGCRAAAAFPLIQGGRSIGAILIHYEELNAFDDEIVKLLERMAENVSFGLDNFEREAERKRVEARIQHLASHDALTSLPNRVMFSEVLNIAIQSAQRNNRKFAVLFIDLDRFKVINDTLGHEAGDQLLQEMGTRIKDTVRTSDVVARLSGDEFVVLVQEVGESDQIETVARKILSAVIKPMVISGQECRVSASVGICMYPANAQTEQSLMKNADIAMYHAKEAGKNTYKFYSQHTARP